VTDLTLIIIYSLLSGSTILVGGILSYYFGDHVKDGHVKEEIIHISIAFGGGILMAAVGLVLVPEGIEVLPMTAIVLCFAAGAVSFLFIDQYMAKKGGTMAQLLSMLSDFVPESITMGAVFTQNHQLGILLTIIIGIQNLPESFNAYMDLKTNFSARISLLILLLLSFSGVVSAVSGYYFLADMPKLVGGLMLFSSGGIVYLIFQDIAPMSKLNRYWIPALGASLGFLVGMVGVKILG
jgi:ZIP family zinc transporter